MEALPAADQSREVRQLKEDLQRLRGLRPIDDDFMRCLFRDHIPLAQFVLRILMGKPDLVITELNTQADMKRLAGARSLCWMFMRQMIPGESMILKCRGKGKVPDRAEPDTMQVLWQWKI